METRPLFMPELSEADRGRVLRDNYESKHETYYKDLNQEEIDERQHDLSKNCIDIFKLEKRLKEIKEDYKAQIDPLKDNNKQLMTEIDIGQTEVSGELFFVPDFDEKIMITYDVKGAYVSHRRLKPGEQQQRMSFLQAVPLPPAANDE